jgi:sortase A
MRKLLLLSAVLVLLIGFGFSFAIWQKRMNQPLPPPPSLPEQKPETFHRGEPIGEVEIPRLHLSVPVFEGDDAAILDLGAGHVPGTALPGRPGNICIAAHRDKDFRALRFIRPGDDIVLEIAQGELRFEVTSTQIVKPTETQVLMPAPGRDLTLVTCYPFYYVGSAPERFIVHAKICADDNIYATLRAPKHKG